MIRALALAAFAALALSAGTAAASDWTDKDVQKLLEKRSQGKAFAEQGQVASQVLVLHAEHVAYVVDLKAQLCLVGPKMSGATPPSLTPVSCAAVKKGYPMFAPLITWEP